MGRNLYFSQDKMLLSCAIAGAKWGIQLLAALLWLPGKKWVFIRRIGFVCLIGSCVLLPYCLAADIRLSGHGFVLSLILAVAVMIALYHRAVRRTTISQKWFWGWTACLATAISLQVFVVFGLV